MLRSFFLILCIISYANSQLGKGGFDIVGIVSNTMEYFGSYDDPNFSEAMGGLRKIEAQFSETPEESQAKFGKLLAPTQNKIMNQMKILINKVDNNRRILSQSGVDYCLTELVSYENTLNTARKDFSRVMETDNLNRTDSLKHLSKTCANNECVKAVNAIINLLIGETATGCNILESLWNSEFATSISQASLDSFAQKVSHWITIVNLGLVISGFEKAVTENSTEFALKYLDDHFSEGYKTLIVNSKGKLKEAERLLQRPRVYYNQTKPTDWEQATDGRGLYATVDISHLKLNAKPIVITSIEGTGRHWALAGGSSVYNVTNTSFAVHVKYNYPLAKYKPGSETSDVIKYEWALNYVIYDQDL